MVKKAVKKLEKMKTRPARRNKGKVSESSGKDTEIKQKQTPVKGKPAIKRILRKKKTFKGRKAISKQTIPDVIKEANDKDSSHLSKATDENSQAQTHSSDTSQNSTNLKSKRNRTLIQEVIPPKLIYVFPPASTSTKLTSNNLDKTLMENKPGSEKKITQAKMKTDVSVVNTMPGAKRMSVRSDKKNSEVQPKSKRKQLEPPYFYLNASDDTPRWRGPLRNYSRVKAHSDAHPKVSDLATVEKTIDKPKEKISLSNNTHLEDDCIDSEIVASSSNDNINMSEIREKLANAGSSITDSLPCSMATHSVSHQVKLTKENLAYKTQLQKTDSSNAVSSSKIITSPKIKVSFLKTNSSSSNSVQSSSIGIKSNLSPSSSPFRMESAKANHSVKCPSPEGGASTVQATPFKTKSLVVKTSPSVSISPSQGISIYPRTSKKSATVKSSEPSSATAAVSSLAKQINPVNMENCSHEGKPVESNCKPSSKATRATDRNSTLPVKRAHTSKKRSFDESDESIDYCADANAALTKYFADPDFHFLMSLMPFLRKMSLSDRLKARIKIQEVIYDVGNFER